MAFSIQARLRYLAFLRVHNVDHGVLLVIEKGNDTIEHAVIIRVSVGTDSPSLSFMLLVRLIDCVIHEVVGFSFEIIGIPIEVIKRLHLVWISRAVTILIPVVFIYISSVCPVEHIGLVFHTGIFSAEYTIQAFYCLDDIFFKEVLFIAGTDSFADDALPESLCGRVEEVASLGAAELVGVLLPLTCGEPPHAYSVELLELMPAFGASYREYLSHKYIFFLPWQRYRRELTDIVEPGK